MAKQPKRAPIAGIDPVKVDEEVLTTALKDRGLASAGSVEAKIKRLVDYLAEKGDRRNVVKCERCGGTSDLTFTICPFCGEAGTDEDSPPAPLSSTARDWRSLELHPAAEFFPPSTKHEMGALIQSMRDNGYDPDRPVVLVDGKVIDGRNRLKAAEVAGVEPRLVDAPPGADPYTLAWSYNGARRDLTPDVRAAVLMKLLDASAASTAGKGQAKDAKGRFQKAAEGTSVAALAARAGVGVQTVERVARLRREDPDSFELVAAGRARANALLAKAMRQKVERSIEVVQEPAPAPGPGEPRALPAPKRPPALPLAAMKGAGVFLDFGIESLELMTAGSEKTPSRPALSIEDEPCYREEVGGVLVCEYRLARNQRGHLILIRERRPLLMREVSQEEAARDERKR